jgi:hypothetical protein
LQLVQITSTAGQSWMAAEATGLSFSLAFGPLSLTVTGGALVINQAPVGQPLKNWSLVAIPASAQVSFSAALNGSIGLQVSGHAEIDVAGLLTINGYFQLTQFTPVDPDVVALVGAGATGLALMLQVSGGIPTGIVSGAGTLRLIRITSLAGQSWLGVEATELDFGLNLPPITLSVNGQLRLNQASPGATKLDWDSLSVASSSSTDPLDHNGLPFGLNVDQSVGIHLEVGGSITVGAGNVIVTVPLVYSGMTVVSGIVVDITTADVNTGNTAITGLGLTPGVRPRPVIAVLPVFTSAVVMSSTIPDTTVGPLYTSGTVTITLPAPTVIEPPTSRWIPTD